MTLADLLARRAKLLVRCADVDKLAVFYRERDEELPIDVRGQFSAHDELRDVERQIAKLKEGAK